MVLKESQCAIALVSILQKPATLLNCGTERLSRVVTDKPTR